MIEEVLLILLFITGIIILVAFSFIAISELYFNILEYNLFNNIINSNNTQNECDKEWILIIYG